MVTFGLWREIQIKLGTSETFLLNLQLQEYGGDYEEAVIQPPPLAAVDSPLPPSVYSSHAAPSSLVHEATMGQWGSDEESGDRNAAGFTDKTPQLFSPILFSSSMHIAFFCVHRSV